MGGLCLPPSSQPSHHPTNNGIENQNICQYDGNVTVTSSSDLSNSYSSCPCCDILTGDVTTTSSDPDYDLDDPVSTIPVIQTQRSKSASASIPPAWYDEYNPRVIDPKQSKVNRKTVRRDNRLVGCESLPIMSVSNLRSFWPKLNNFKNDMEMRDISLAMLSEVWEKQNCKKQQHELEKMLNMDGLKYISTPRTTKRGGGAAIVVSLKKFTLEKIEVLNPDKVEVVFGLLRPKKTTSNVKEIIVAAFYSPPKSRKNPQLLDHLLSTTLHLLSKYPTAGVVLGGDKNNLNITSLLNGIPKLRQIVTKCTYNSKILDIILTNMASLY